MKKKEKIEKSKTVNRWLMAPSMCFAALSSLRCTFTNFAHALLITWCSWCSCIIYHDCNGKQKFHVCRARNGMFLLIISKYLIILSTRVMNNNAKDEFINLHWRSSFRLLKIIKNYVSITRSNFIDFNIQTHINSHHLQKHNGRPFE